MSSAGNRFVNFNGGGSPYDMQMYQAQRQQRLAEQLQQEASDPIQVMQGGGQPAPIPWTAVLAKAMQGVAGSVKERRAMEMMKKAGAEDSDAAKELLRQLQQTHPDVKATAPQDINIQMPQLPGQEAPPQMAPSQIQVPVPSTGAAQVGPTTQQQLAMLLGAEGGPKTDRIASVMAPEIFRQQHAVEDQKIRRDDKTWENTLPMSQAAKDQVKTQEAAAEQGALFKNNLPQTADQRAKDALERSKQADLKKYHDQMSGIGLTEDGQPNPAVESWIHALSTGAATSLSQVPAPLRTPVAMGLQKLPKEMYTPLAGSRFTLESNRIVKNLMDLPQYQLTAQGLPFLQRIDAAMKTKGSVSDQDLLDSFTKLSTAGNAITDAQVRIITDGKSLSDWAGVMLNRLKTGGVLSDKQRQDIKKIGNDVYANYSKGYQPVYDQAIAQLTAAGVPQPFWTIPDLNKLNKGMAGGDAPPGGKTVHWNDLK